ncbi:hypothetical protein RND81_10G018600 [Saponaria officinalis]|uniref:CCHC-type domain-containing protein n=1 Tax=Saponaria officinalis TaxID=3572 RepID=A0AAW1HXE6_SAPOF
MALESKNKGDFITGKLPKPAKTYPKYNQWIRCDLMVLKWTLHSIAKPLHDDLFYAKSSKELWTELSDRYGQPNALELYQLKKDLTNISQENAPLVEHYSRLKRTWEDIDSIDLIPTCSCGALDLCSCQLLKKLLDRETRGKLIQLLMGLHSGYDSVISSVLTMEPLPPIDKVLGLLQKIERQKQISDDVEVLAEANAYASTKHVSYPNESHWKKARIEEKPVRECTFCHKRGHLREDCFKLKECTYCHGKGHIKEHCYKLRSAPHTQSAGLRFSSGKTFHKGANVYKRSSNHVDVHIMTDIVSNVVNQVMKTYAERTPSAMHSANFAGTCLSSRVFHASHSIPNVDWIVDTGATDHMTSHVDLLHDVGSLSRPVLVALPDESTKRVHQIGRLVLTPHIVLTHVLVVPDFQRNLLSVRKLLSSSNLTVIFISHECQFHDLSSKVIVATAKKRGDLYKLSPVGPSAPVVFNSSVDGAVLLSNASSSKHSMFEKDIALFHARLGHSLCDKMRHMYHVIR